MEQDLEQKYYEVIVVSNNSTDNTEEMVSKFFLQYPFVSLVNERRQGLSHARNTGWKIAKGCYVAYIDDDARASVSWCRLIVEAFEKVKPTPVAVGGKILPDYEIEPPSWFSEKYELRTWGEKEKFLEQSKGRQYFSGSNMSFLKTTLEDYGGFNPALGMQGSKVFLGEDTDLFLRIKPEQKLFWYNPAIKVHHWTPKENLTVKYRLGRAYLSGKALAKISKSKVSTITLVRNTLGTILMIVKLPIKIFMFFNNKTCLIDYICAIVERVGYLSLFEN